MHISREKRKSTRKNIHLIKEEGFTGFTKKGIEDGC